MKRWRRRMLKRLSSSFPGKKETRYVRIRSTIQLLRSTIWQKCLLWCESAGLCLSAACSDSINTINYLFQDNFCHFFRRTARRSLTARKSPPARTSPTARKSLTARTSPPARMETAKTTRRRRRKRNWRMEKQQAPRPLPRPHLPPPAVMRWRSLSSVVFDIITCMTSPGPVGFKCAPSSVACTFWKWSAIKCSRTGIIPAVTPHFKGWSMCNLHNRSYQQCQL